MMIWELEAFPRDVTPEPSRSSTARSLTSEEINNKAHTRTGQVAWLRHGEPHFFFVRNEPGPRAVGLVFP
jgi:hypothetical protein